MHVAFVSLTENLRNETLCFSQCSFHPQQAETVFNKILGPSNKKYPGLISMLQGFQKCIASNPSK